MTRKLPSLTLLATVGALCIASFANCGGGKSEKEMAKQIDSLQNVNKLAEMRYDDLQDYLAVIASSLDSINLEENEMLVGFSEGGPYNRQRMKENVSHVREILANHRQKIADLEAKLANDNGQLKNLKTIITTLRQQIDAKDQELAQLRADLDNSKKDISMLTSRVQEISEESQAKDITILDQQETIIQQADKINSGYVRIGKKKELEAAGLLKGGGFLRKKKVDYSNIDLSKFQKVDISNFQLLELPKKYEIKTEVPKGSYNIEEYADYNVLVITDPNRFWSVSNFLIIEDKTK